MHAGIPSVGDALNIFRRYAQAFQALDPIAVARYFDEPSLLVTPQGVAAMRTVAEIEQTYGRMMADLPGQGYAGTEFSELAERRLSDDLALVTGKGAWKKISGEKFAPFGLTYLLRRTADTWRIVMATIYRRDAPG